MTYDEERLMWETDRLARREGVTLAELRHEATYGTVQAQEQASKKIAKLQRAAAKRVDHDPDDDGRDEEYEYDDAEEDDTGDAYDDRDEDSGDDDIDHLPGHQKRDKKEQRGKKREARLMEATERLALSEGVNYGELRHTAQYGTPEAQARASMKIQQLQRRASYGLDD